MLTAGQIIRGQVANKRQASVKTNVYTQMIATVPRRTTANTRITDGELMPRGEKRAITLCQEDETLTVREEGDDWGVDVFSLFL